MKHIADNVYLFESTKQSRAYLITLPAGNVIVDTSTPGSAPKMQAELAAMDIQPRSIKHIILTHYDVDHIGGAAALQAASGATVWLQHPDTVSAANPAKRPVVKRLLGLFMKPATPEVNGIITADGEIIPGITAVHTPGHTAGHTVYLYNDILFSGDAIKVKKDGSLGLLPAFLTADTALARTSVHTVSSLKYSLICPAHQEPHWIPHQ